MDCGNAGAACQSAVTLVFVYNAEAGVLNGIMDSAHKLFSPSTYACDLCAITHGLTRIKPEWRAWLQQSGRDVQFYHRSDFRQAWPAVDIPLPTILMQEGDRLRPVISASDLAQISDVGQLVALLEARCDGGKNDDPAL
jgi:hypothetical protein